jgi:hypothetical protein
MMQQVVSIMCAQTGSTCTNSVYSGSEMRRRWATAIGKRMRSTLTTSEFAIFARDCGVVVEWG